jgi:IS30 family transposase
MVNGELTRSRPRRSAEQLRQHGDVERHPPRLVARQPLKGGNERRLRAVGCETIYAFSYRAAQRAEQLWRYLTRRHKRRRPRRSRHTIKDRVSIHERPKTVDGRTEGGHWEGDLIICKRTRPVLVLHERKSRVTLAARLAGKTAAETISVMLAVFARIEPALRKSITFDNDTAFAQHALLRTMRAMTTWFCDAYASWQKGGVENANGRLRRWLPRQIDIDQVSDEEIQDIVLRSSAAAKADCWPRLAKIRCVFFWPASGRSPRNLIGTLTHLAG